MIDRRRILGWFGALPLVGVGGSGFAGDPPSTAPVPDGYGTVYAEKGELVTCEFSHPICEFVETVRVGQTQNLGAQLGGWRQPVPRYGAIPLPVCAKCGGMFTNGSIFHFADGWRFAYRERHQRKAEWRGS